MGLHLFFRQCLPVRPVLALLCTCANGSNGSVFQLQLLVLLHVVAGAEMTEGWATKSELGKKAKGCSFGRGGSCS